MSTLILLLLTGLGLGALYFLVASGLSLIYGLMGVLNFAHGSFLTLAAFSGFEVGRRIGISTVGGFMAAILVGAPSSAACSRQPPSSSWSDGSMNATSNRCW